jgi:hypothetical protein
MLRSLKDLEGYRVAATDGEIGSVVNFLFDDERWAVRYLVVKTGSFFDQRKALISPIFFSGVDWSTDLFHLALTMDKIKKSPPVDTDMPVSRQHERDYYRYYGYPYYWGYSGAWAMGAYPGWLAHGGWDNVPEAKNSDEISGDVHLRSVNEVRGYHVQGSDDAIGKVADFEYARRARNRNGSEAGRRCTRRGARSLPGARRQHRSASHATRGISCARVACSSLSPARGRPGR